MTVSKVEFEICTSYHQPVGRSRRGHNEFYFMSRCGRWHVRQGNRGNMIVTDRRADVVHVVPGKMPEVQEFVSTQPAV